MATYEGRDGLRHEMTTIDLDPKIKVSTSVMNEEELSSLQEQIKLDKMSQILAILSFPAVCVSGTIHDKYVWRNKEAGVQWYNEMIQEACMIDDTLRYNMWMHCWKSCIQPQFWDVDLSYKEVIDGLWKQYKINY